MKDKKVKIKYMSDFVDLFLAMYSKDNQKDGKIYISRNMKIILNSIMNNIHLSHNEFGEEIYTEEDKFNIDLFLERLRYSKVKDGWRDDIIYDFKNDSLMTKISNSEVKKILDKSNPLSIMLMSHVVSLYEIIDKHLEVINSERIEKITLKYVE